MSFATDIKTELANLKSLTCCNVAELSALLHVGGAMEISSKGLALTFQTTNNAVIRKVIRLIKDLYHVELTVMSKQQVRLRKNDIYMIRIEDKVETILNELSLINKNALFFQDVDESLIKKECCKKAYLRGAFLAGGSINSPETSAYHLEIQTYSERQAEVIQKIAQEFNLNAKVARNKRGFITYMKEAERISDFLRVTGATNQLFVYEDSRIKRDFKNSINRVMNCDIANEKKALDAANNQLRYITIVETKGTSEITKSLREAIFLRKTYPEATLLELASISKTHFPEPISKSALNHRFRALKDLAMQCLLKEENQ
ncbi:MAG: DNA-binding protein WhiA [Candidatus Izemoplasmatales bacterium]|nr:DNA-binding protein WhiA [Candidatus Izemoplasmatales bacterium]